MSSDLFHCGGGGGGGGVCVRLLTIVVKPPTADNLVACNSKGVDKI